MSQDHSHLNHATWECKYHVVFTPKYRKKALFGQVRRQLGSVFHDLARRKECRIEERHLLGVIGFTMPAGQSQHSRNRGLRRCCRSFAVNRFGCDP
jgi:Transposase IS200 like